jgi:hypothetical protein
MLYKVLGVMLLTSTTKAEAEDKWLWSGSGRSAATPNFPGETARPLYR